MTPEYFTAFAKYICFMKPGDGIPINFNNLILVLTVLCNMVVDVVGVQSRMLPVVIIF